MRRGLLLAMVLAALLGTAASAVEYTYVDLVKKLTDLEGLAVLPVPGEVCAQWSSYDRASAYDANAGKYVGWDANGDGNGIIRMEGNQQVFAEIEGPGCIWRTWSAAPRDGHVQIYLDGAAEPTVDLAFKEYFDLNHAPFVYPSLVYYASSGANSYVPIPFQKSCKIIADKDWGAYFQFTYTKYPKGTVLPTFTRDLGPKERLALKTANIILSDNLGKDPSGRLKMNTLGTLAIVAPGEKATVAKLSGKYAITGLNVKLDKKQYTDEELAGLILKIYWDGEKEPSVWAPLVSFFGSAPGINNYKSLPLGMTDDGLYCYWYMPFAKSAVIELENDGKGSFKVPFNIAYAPLSKPIDRLGRFHAKWHRDAYLPNEPERWIDWPMLVTQGKGRFCGVALEVWNPRGGWWGEGDEKFFVDGEKFPSTIGTGSEDYFGYAWCNPGLFQNAYHNQTRNDGNNRGHVSVNRWHIVDNIPFQKSYEADIEKYYLNKRPTTYACVSYWYLAPGGVDSYSSVALNERMAMYIPAEVVTVKGAIEGEKLKVVSSTAGITRTQDLGDEGWSNSSHLWWTDAKVGDKLTLAVPVTEAGKYELKAQLTKAGDYGIVQLFLDGEKIGDSIDLYNKGVTYTGQLSFGIHDLTVGDHQLGIEIVGANKDAAKAYMFGLDYIKLDSVPK